MTKRRLATLPLLLVMLYLLVGLLPTMMLFGGGQRPDTWIIIISPFILLGLFGVLAGLVALFLYGMEDSI